MKKNGMLVAILILNLLTIVLGLLVKVYGVITLANIVLSIYYLNNEDRTLISDRKILIVMGIINLLSLKWISAVLDLILYDDASREERFQKIESGEIKVEEVTVPEKPKVDPKVKKIDLTIKIGVFMVFVAGFIFATTGWESLNIFIKGFIFILISALFIFLSKYSEKNIKIKSTIYLYWFLGMAFITFIYIAIGLNNLFGIYFSLNGAGESLFMASIFIVIAILGLISYFNLKSANIMYITYTAVLIAIIETMVHFDLLLETSLAVILGLFTLLELMDYKEDNDLYTLKIFSESGAVLTIFAFALLSFSYTQIASTLMLSLLALINVYLLSMKHQDKPISNFVSIGYFLALLPAFSLVENAKTYIVLLLIFVTANYILSLTYKNESAKKISLVVSDVLVCITFFVSYPEGYLMTCLVTAVALYISGMTFSKEGFNKIEFLFIPVKLLLIIISLLLLIEKYVFDVNVIGTSLTLTFLLVAFVYFATTNEETKKVFKFYSGILPVVSLVYLISYELIDDTSMIAISLASFVAMLILYFGSNMYHKDETDSFKLYTYILLLIYLYVVPKIFGYIYIRDSYILYTGIISMLFYIGVAILNREDEYDYNLALLAVGVPFFSILNNTELDVTLSTILMSLLVYYLTFTIAQIVKSELAKQIIGYIGYSLAFLMVVLNDDPYIILYAIVLASLSILFGFLNKKNDCKFFIGIIAIIIEILFGFRELWAVIPIWAYILIFGIILILFATYVQAKDIKKKDNDKKE